MGTAGGSGTGDTINMPAQKVFAVLTEIACRGGTSGVTELAQALAMPKTTVYRITRELEQLGYLQRMPGERRLVLTSDAIDMAVQILQAGVCLAPRHAALLALAESTGESCSLGVRVGYEVTYLDDVTTPSLLTLHFKRGHRAPLHCTSIGKLFLGRMTSRELDEYLQAAPLSRYTDWTVTDPAGLREIAAQARNDGFVTSNQEFVLGVVGAAVPVLGRGGRMIAGLAVSVPAARMRFEELGRLRPLLEATAEKLARTFR